MKAITQYKAEDGTVFSDENQCAQYEKTCKKLDNIMAFMGPVPRDKGCTWTNGGGYIPHKPADVENAKNQLLVLARSMGIDAQGFGILGRYLDDSGNKAMYSAWGRLFNCDSQGREWGQGYYAYNPNKGVQKVFVDSE